MGGMDDLGFPMWYMTAFYLIIVAISILPLLYLYRFAHRMQLALRFEDQIILSESFNYLKLHYAYIGICIAIICIAYALGTIGMVVWGASAGGF